MKILVKTLFDCAPTGTTGHFRPSELPLVDRQGSRITNQAEWNRSRNKQRNWETVLQVVSLRCQPTHIETPQYRDQHWVFSYVVDIEGVYGQGDKDLTMLLQDCNGVPMIVNLDETQLTSSMLCTSGPDQNIWFEALNS